MLESVVRDSWTFLIGARERVLESWGEDGPNESLGEGSGLASISLGDAAEEIEEVDEVELECLCPRL